MTSEILSISELSRRLRDNLFDMGLQQVRGEISNFRKHGPSGHMYFMLKDSQAQLEAVMFQGDARGLKFLPADGLSVEAKAELDVYPARGRLQLVVRAMSPAGRGSLMEAFEKLKSKLAAEGLFDPETKKALPAFPRTVGLVTSSHGAAVRDLASVLRKRWPSIHIVLADAQVQGDGASRDIARALSRLDRWGEADVIILGRGGGSLEDLWAFNEEPVARAIAACRTPVISAVGHETDVTIADFTADVRAATPSAAAEIAVPSGEEYRSSVRILRRRLILGGDKAVRHRRSHLTHLSRAHGFRRPADFLRSQTQNLDHMGARLNRALSVSLGSGRKQTARMAERLGAQHPRALFLRGTRAYRKLGRRLHRGGQRGLKSADARVRSVSREMAALDPAAVLQRGYALVRRDGWEGPVVAGAGGLAPQSSAYIQFAEDRAEMLVIKLFPGRPTATRTSEENHE